MLFALACAEDPADDAHREVDVACPAYERRRGERIRFERGLAAQIMAIDGTWKRVCRIAEISEADATLVVKGSVQGLGLAEFFLLLSASGLAYRRCALDWVNGDNLRVRFLEAKGRPVVRSDHYLV